MAKLHRLHPNSRVDCRTETLAGQLVPLPSIDLDTVIMTMEILRDYPDPNVLDNFNRVARPGRSV